MVDGEIQEDRYYRLKTAIEEAVGTTISSEKMNRLFFDVLETPYSELMELRRRYEDVRAALQVLAIATMGREGTHNDHDSV